MPTTLKIELTPQAQKLVASMQTLPGRVMDAIRLGMDQANQIALGKIKSEHLTGQGPFPVEEHKLGRITGRLRGSVYASGAQQTSGSQVDSAIGSNVIYAAIHEFGGVIHHPARQAKVRHKTDARGNLVKQLSNEKLLVFAKAGAKRARETTVEIPAHDTTMPERAPIRTGIAESAPAYTRNISRQILAAWKGLQ